MTFNTFMRATEKMILDNAPLIATTIGVAGTVTTAILSGRAVYKTVIAVEEENISREFKGMPPAKAAEIAAISWQYYIPPVIVGTITISSIISANRISTKRAAALAAAYSLSEKAFGEYRDKVAERFNSSQERRVRDDIAQEHVIENPPKSNEIVVTGNGDVMCYDDLTGRYFLSSMEKLRSAVNTINEKILSSGYASLTELYDEFGLKATAFSEEVGWKDNQLISVTYSTVMSDDGRPCISISYDTHPVRDYFRYHLR